MSYTPISFTKKQEQRLLRRDVPIESRKERHQQKRAEEDAFGQQEEGILFPYYQCKCCEICIGPNYVEQQLYIYVTKEGEQLYLGDTLTEFKAGTLLNICGDCARRRNLLASDCMIQPEHWLTTILIHGETHRLQVVDHTNVEQVFAIRVALLERVHHMRRERRTSPVKTKSPRKQKRGARSIAS